MDLREIINQESWFPDSVCNQDNDQNRQNSPNQQQCLRWRSSYCFLFSCWPVRCIFGPRSFSSWPLVMKVCKCRRIKNFSKRDSLDLLSQRRRSCGVRIWCQLFQTRSGLRPAPKLSALSWLRRVLRFRQPGFHKFGLQDKQISEGESNSENFTNYRFKQNTVMKILRFSLLSDSLSLLNLTFAYSKNFVQSDITD